ncbi:MAG: SH3 domain-containing protein [Vicinamibacterales bacterium]
MPHLVPAPSRRHAALVVLAAVAGLGVGAWAQTPAAAERVRVRGGHANIHKGPNTTTEVLVLAPRDTVLAVVARDKEWVQVRLTPELRKTGLVMRWYKNEDRGWMHDSTVVVEQ